MTYRDRREHGFTLIELMIVVAIIGLLATIAIPNFLSYQLESKTIEAKTNLAGILGRGAVLYGGLLVLLVREEQRQAGRDSGQCAVADAVNGCSTDLA